ncbi:Peroxisomal membrane protein PER10 [Coniochaeta hoffmannii]|uniref:Peroxisomal membrane protein PEX14 n=1 Tax=Coniochaeta hoffmannii TaxID=91930 RepID=A0AA38VCB6_9PEZI|nr:Peroxisomal membrane protein PER10 [Coniochaeta hoffmannii]
MAIREDLVASAAKFLQDPNVASSPVENRIAFLQAKHLTQEEINAALARAASESGTAPPPQYAAPQQAVAQQGQPYYGQYPQQYPPYAWQPTPQEIPRRDWRDWFIMATVVSGVGYGLYSLGKRYVYPLVAPPTPERLEQDKKTIDEQFEKAFALVDQLAKDTEALKAAEQQRTERLDTALSELETVITELKSSNRRREDDAQRVRDDVQNLKDAIPTALDKQKQATDTRLMEVNTELKSLKTLITQRMNPSAAATASPSTSSYLRPSSGNAAGGPASSAPATPAAAATSTGSENADTAKTNGKAPEEPKKQDYQDYASTLNRSSPFSSGAPPAKASIPAWQMAMANKNSSNAAGSSSAGASGEAGGSGAKESS